MIPDSVTPPAHGQISGDASAPQNIIFDPSVTALGEIASQMTTGKGLQTSAGALLGHVISEREREISRLRRKQDENLETEVRLAVAESKLSQLSRTATIQSILTVLGGVIVAIGGDLLKSGDQHRTVSLMLMALGLIIMLIREIWVHWGGSKK